jgi:GIY-YIG catalytic domain
MDNNVQPIAKPVVIYALIDPRNGRIRYVGKTNQNLKSRLSAHILEKSKCHRCHWLDQLKAAGLKPLMAQLELVQTRTWQEAERHWIKTLKAEGCDLTNNTSGGDGVPDLPPEVRARISRAWIGRKHKPETIEKLRGRTFNHTQDHKERMSRIMTGRKILWVDKISKANRKLNEGMISEIKRRLNAGELVKDLAAEFRVHRTTLSKINTGIYHLPYRKNSKVSELNLEGFLDKPKAA